MTAFPPAINSVSLAAVCSASSAETWGPSSSPAPIASEWRWTWTNEVNLLFNFTDLSLEQNIDFLLTTGLGRTRATTWCMGVCVCVCQFGQIYSYCFRHIDKGKGEKGSGSFYVYLWRHLLLLFPALLSPSLSLLPFSLDVAKVNIHCLFISAWKMPSSIFSLKSSLGGNKHPQICLFGSVLDFPLVLRIILLDKQHGIGEFYFSFITTNILSRCLMAVIIAGKYQGIFSC